MIEIGYANDFPEVEIFAARLIDNAKKGRICFNPESALGMGIPPRGLTKSLRINHLSGLNPDIKNHHFGS